MKTKTEREVVWCVYLDINLDPQWCISGSKEAKALSSCPDYVVGYYSSRKDRQVIEDAAATRNGLRQLRKAA
ncbi:hypothetical protein [Acidithiobacillus sp.]